MSPKEFGNWNIPKVYQIPIREWRNFSHQFKKIIIQLGEVKTLVFYQGYFSFLSSNFSFCILKRNLKKASVTFILYFFYISWMKSNTPMGCLRHAFSTFDNFALERRTERGNRIKLNGYINITFIKFWIQIWEKFGSRNF